MASFITVKLKNGTERTFGDGYYGANTKYEGAFVIIFDGDTQKRHSFPAADVAEVIERTR